MNQLHTKRRGPCGLTIIKYEVCLSGKTFVYINSRNTTMVTLLGLLCSPKSPLSQTPASFFTVAYIFWNCLQPKFHDLPAWFPGSENIILKVLGNQLKLLPKVLNESHFSHTHSHTKTHFVCQLQYAFPFLCNPSFLGPHKPVGSMKSH